MEAFSFGALLKANLMGLCAKSDDCVDEDDEADDDDDDDFADVNELRLCL